MLQRLGSVETGYVGVIVMSVTVRYSCHSIFTYYGQPYVHNIFTTGNMVTAISALQYSHGNTVDGIIQRLNVI